MRSLFSWFSRTRAHKPKYTEPMRHLSTLITLENLGKIWHPFIPTFSYPGTYLNRHHRVFAECPLHEGLIDIGIKGYLLPDDALKLYELAYCVRGDVLEFGCYHGLSTYILAMAISDSGARKKLLSNDVQPKAVTIASALLQRNQYDGFSDIQCCDTVSLCRKLVDEGRLFDLVFIDHSHTYEDVTSVCKVLDDLVSPGGMCLFHDYNNEWNADPSNHNYGVWQAVQDHLSTELFEFYGSYGCSGLFRRKRLPKK